MKGKTICFVKLLQTFFVSSFKYFLMTSIASFALLLTCSPGIERFSIDVITNLRTAAWFSS